MGQVHLLCGAQAGALQPSTCVRPAPAFGQPWMVLTVPLLSSPGLPLHELCHPDLLYDGDIL